jgi:6-phosphogluconolactonase (cycloisomerase 2 family)
VLRIFTEQQHYIRLIGTHESSDDTSSDGTLATRPVSVSRRSLLQKSAAVIAIATHGASLSESQPAAHPQPATGSAAKASGGYVYVGGSYNSDPSANAISTFTRDPASGSLKLSGITKAPDNPSFLVLDRARSVLYAGNEVASNGAVTAYRANSDGSLTFINSAPNSTPPGTGPAHISIHPSGKYLLAASWGGASFSVMPILANGGVGAPVDFITHNGSLGPGQTQAHPHMIEADPSGKFVLLQDLGQDRTYIFTLDLTTGKLSAGPTPFVQTRPGSGPRHFVFHPRGRRMYSINEIASTIDVYLWSPESGSLMREQTFSTLPAGYQGTNTCAEIAVSPDGRFLYGSNRGFDSIVTFPLAPDGTIRPAAKPSWTWTRGETPRNFAITRDGRFLYVGNQGTNTIVIFAIDSSTGALAPTGDYVRLASPACIRLT